MSTVRLKAVRLNGKNYFIDEKLEEIRAVNDPHNFKSISEYELKALLFLHEHGISFSAAFKGNKCPMWCEDKHIHGDRYLITFRRLGTRQKLSLSFWNSLNDSEKGKEPSPYDVLAAIQKYDPGTPENFFSDFGYSEDSIKANKTYKAVVNEWEKNRNFFTITELGELEDIQ